MTILLSICIPTFNRAGYIVATIESVLQQISIENAGYVEICISDNASTDNTEQLVLDMIDSAGCQVKYSRNDENLGFDLNIQKVVSIASGQFCWILGSDDLAAKHSIDFLLSKIFNCAKIDLFIFPRENFNAGSEHLGVTQWLDQQGVKKRRYDFSQSNVLEDYYSHAISIGAGFSYISSMVFRKELWDGVEVDPRVIGSFYVHAFILGMACAQGITLEYIDNPLVRCRIGNDSFAESGRLKRVAIDFIAYSMFSELMPMPERTKKSYLKILRVEHNYLNVFRHMCHPAILSDRIVFCHLLKRFGYSISVVYVFALLTSFGGARMAKIFKEFKKY